VKIEDGMNRADGRLKMEDIILKMCHVSTIDGR